MTANTPETEETMRRFYHSLDEKARRRYAGLEALKCGHGGRQYIARVLGCSRNTVSKGACEVSGLPKREVARRIRQPGGGRTPDEIAWGAGLDEKFLAVLHDHTAGDPMDETGALDEPDAGGDRARVAGRPQHQSEQTCGGKTAEEAQVLPPKSPEAAELETSHQKP